MDSKIVCPVYSSMENKNPRNSEGSFVHLKDGRIAYYYTCYYGDSYDDHATANIAVRYSSDEGETWTESQTVINGHENGNVMSVSLLRLQDGRLLMIYLRKDKLAGTEAYTCKPQVRFSSDEGETWSEPDGSMILTPAYVCGNNDRIIQLANGRLIYPVSHHLWINFGGIVFCYYSDDSGQSWKPGQWILPPVDQADRQTGLQEPGVIELPDGSVMCWQRTNYHHQWKCYSTDKGETWSLPEPAYEFPSNLAPLQIKRNPYTGEYTAVWNDTSEERWHVKPDYSSWSTARSRLVIAFSKDCRNWERHETIEYDPEAGFCYPAIEFTKDGGILLAYCCGGHGKCCLQDLCIRKIYSC